MHTRHLSTLTGLTLAALLAACSGGGGGGVLPPTGGGGGGPTPQPQSYTVTGTVQDYDSGAAIAGAQIEVGQIPPTTCAYGYSACGQPLSPVTATSTADGTFAVTLSATGTYMLQVAAVAADTNPANTQTYAILHRSIGVTSSTSALGVIKLSKLSADEQAWIAQLNSDRATLAVPATGPVVVDEYAEEQARAGATYMEDNPSSAGDATESVYDGYYAAMPGALGGAAGALGGAFSPPSTHHFEQAEAGWFSERTQCQGNIWTTCPFTNTGLDTGHYINLAVDSLTWVGLGSWATAGQSSPIGYTDFVITVYGGASTYTGTGSHYGGYSAATVIRQGTNGI